MVDINGKLLIEDGALCVKMQISPQNPELFDIPLEELLDEYVGKEIHMEVLPVEHRWRDLE